MPSTYPYINVLLSICLIILSFGCTQAVQRSPLDEAKPATIIFKKSDAGGVQSYSSEVENYLTDNRVTGSTKKVSSYRLSVKLIDGKVYTRLDYPSDALSGIRNKAVITSPTETIMLDTGTGKVEQRMPTPQVTGINNPQGMAKLFQRIPKEKIFDDLKKAHLDFTIDSTGNRLSFDLPVESSYPNEILSLFQGKKILSSRIYFDLAKEQYSGTELKFQESADQIVTVETIPIYQEAEGELIKVADVTQIKQDFTGTIDTSDRTIPPQPQDIASVPVVTEEELNRLKDSGAQIFEMDPLTGDPGDPDTSKTMVTIYDQISINDVKDILFKPLLK